MRWIPLLALLLPGAFAAMAAGAPPSASAEVPAWVVSRHYGGRGTTYLIVAHGPTNLLTQARSIVIDEGELDDALQAALAKQGLRPAASAEEAELVISVGYGTGEYPPPFAFMGVDPMHTPFNQWPTALKEYDQGFHRRDYSENLAGYAAKLSAGEIEQQHLLVIAAFDAATLRRKKTWKPRWETRITAPAQRGTLDELLVPLVEAGADLLATNRRSGVRRFVALRARAQLVP